MFNLDKLSQEKLRVLPYSAVHGLLLVGQFEASLILLDDLWDSSLAKYTPNGAIVAAPSRDVLAFCDAKPLLGIVELKQLVERSAANDWLREGLLPARLAAAPLPPKLTAGALALASVGVATGATCSAALPCAPEVMTSRDTGADAGSDYGGRRYAPYALTEPGVTMLSTVLNSERAVVINIEIMRTFVKVRTLTSTQQDLAKQLVELQDKTKSLAMSHETFSRNTKAQLREVFAGRCVRDQADGAPPT